MGYPNGLTIPPWHMEYPPEKAKIDRENAPFLDHFQEKPMNLHSFLDAYWWFKGFRNTTGACWQRASLVLRSRSTSAPQLKQMIRDQKQREFIIHNQTRQRKIPITLVLMGKSTTNNGKIIERHLKWAIVQCHVSLLEGTPNLTKQHALGYRTNHDTGI